VSYISREMAAPKDVVWSVIIDPTSYPRWLIGAEEIRRVDPEWPSPGSAFHHRVGIGPLALPDNSQVEDVEEGRQLRLHVRARPFISAIATFRLVGEGDRTVVSLEEEPTLRFIGNLVRPVLDPLTHLRNHRSLRRLAAVVAERNGNAA
jgi:carbon monoxide dehydrogenase subunit G